MSKKVATLAKEQLYREAFLARLNQKMAIPTEDWPTVRCWTKSAFERLSRSVRNELAAEGMENGVSHRSLLDWITRLCLVSSLPVDGESIYLFEIGARADADVDPLELLMACKPSGVICYFSAVAFHSLTTQPVKHHHVADIRPGTTRPESKRSEGEEAERLNVAGRRVNSLGNQQFLYHGVPIYCTRRSARLVPGIQLRGFGPRAQVRITTLEQTLLDTLSKPFHCGGPEVVFEAWQEGVASNRIDEERLIEYLRVLEYPSTTRRLAVMLEFIGWTPGVKLKRFLDERRMAVDRQSPHARISLLPGVEYQTLNDDWLVNTP